MSALAHDSPVMALGPILREETRRVRDKSYRSCAVGQEVGRFLRAIRWADLSPNTIASYEPTLAKLAQRHDDFLSLEDFCTPLGTEQIRDFLDYYWGDCAASTRKQRLAAVKSFFQWAFEEKRITWNPAAAIRTPKAKGTVRQARGRGEMRRLIAAQETLRDQCALQLYVRLGLRKMDVGLLQIKDIDLARSVLILRHGKGGEEALLPFDEYPDLCEDLYLHIQGEGRKPSEYLLYPKKDTSRPMDPASVHRWFKRCLERAGLPTSIKLHELRHTAGDEMWRETGNIVLAQQLLRHKSLEHTRRYLHPTADDLRSGMRTVARSWEEK
jgi:integrase/recombinase XerD